MRDAPAESLAQVFKHLIRGENIWESTFSRYDLSSQYTSQEVMLRRKTAWQEGWAIAAGDAVLCNNNHFETEMIARKGYRAAPIASSAWAEVAAEYEVNNTLQIISKFEREGREVIPATPDAVQAMNTVWQWLEASHATHDKTKPHIHCFRNKMNAGAILMGYCASDGSGIYINEEQANSGQNKALLITTLEELTHYVTGSTDLSQDFQNFLLQIVVNQNTR
jgi:hypothetical protein